MPLLEQPSAVIARSRPLVEEQAKPLMRRATQWLRTLVGARAFRLIALYPPYLGANVRVRAVAPDASWFDVEMGLRRWNQNYFGTQFGGSLYSMCDPFYALILTEQLGPGHVVWDKAATIRFLRPGRGTVRARFEVAADALDRVRRELAERGRADLTVATDVLGPAGERVAHVTKSLTVRRLGPRPNEPGRGEPAERLHA